MTKEEAQAIIDKIDSFTVIDSNWLNYLISDPEFKILKAIHLIFNMDYNQFLKQYEGHSISGFQTYNEIYVGRTVKIGNDYFIITGQNKHSCYYLSMDGYREEIFIKEINQHLV